MARAGIKESKGVKGLTATEQYALAFGAFLGLALLKFGNPAILDRVIIKPSSVSEVIRDAWPLHWANWVLVVLVAMGAVLAMGKPRRWPATRWLWVLPLIWLGWQVLSATQTADRHLTAVTLWQLGGCVACYFIGGLVVGNGRGWRLLMPGLLAAFTFCLVRAVDQRLIEFPNDRVFLTESQKAGWTNLPPDSVQEMKRENLIINSNGVDIANPLIIDKYGDEPAANASRLRIISNRLFLPKPRINGTLVYPNALAGAVLLLFPMLLAAVLEITRQLRRVVQVAAIGLTVFLGAAGLFWSGSKGGWLVALAAGVVWLCRLNWPRRFKWMMVATLLVGGLVVFGLRFENYFAKGATSVGARFDYWRVAARVAVSEPFFGSGPGTFERPYERLKRPEAEMARLVHNDYLEQFSDSGLIGGLSYVAWIGVALWVIGRRVWAAGGWMEFAVFLGLLSWFVQGLMEFSLYVPALAWTAFALTGCLLRHQTKADGQPVEAPIAPGGKSIRQNQRR